MSIEDEMNAVHWLCLGAALVIHLHLLSSRLIEPRQASSSLIKPHQASSSLIKPHRKEERLLTPDVTPVLCVESRVLCQARLSGSKADSARLLPRPEKVHEGWEGSNVSTAKCDKCHKQCCGTMQKCIECKLSVCQACARKGLLSDDGRHRLDPDCVQWDMAPLLKGRKTKSTRAARRGRPAAGARRRRRHGVVSAESSSSLSPAASPPWPVARQAWQRAHDSRPTKRRDTPVSDQAKDVAAILADMPHKHHQSLVMANVLPPVLPASDARQPGQLPPLHSLRTLLTPYSTPVANMGHVLHPPAKLPLASPRFYASSSACCHGSQPLTPGHDWPSWPQPLHPHTAHYTHRRPPQLAPMLDTRRPTVEERGSQLEQAVRNIQQAEYPDWPLDRCLCLALQRAWSALPIRHTPALATREALLAELRAAMYHAAVGLGIHVDGAARDWILKAEAHLQLYESSALAVSD
ncbi:hypothetical protein CDD81_2407 [Ophiocordyceps australis]|uniref:Uncharacterized protein n=1 Tax=Ophiocordyceps australis TaxID=1399860 RepID=A0A2C5XEP8_9HYPO|nr:hypothetical protein CDD81_2407 [Ophiocordyceps australis]